MIAFSHNGDVNPNYRLEANAQSAAQPSRYLSKFELDEYA
jgi:hypothetical protein